MSYALKKKPPKPQTNRLRSILLSISNTIWEVNMQCLNPNVNQQLILFCIFCTSLMHHCYALLWSSNMMHIPLSHTSHTWAHTHTDTHTYSTSHCCESIHCNKKNRDICGTNLRQQHSSPKASHSPKQETLSSNQNCLHGWMLSQTEQWQPTQQITPAIAQRKTSVTTLQDHSEPHTEKQGRISHPTIHSFTV